MILVGVAVGFHGIDAIVFTGATGLGCQSRSVDASFTKNGVTEMVRRLITRFALGDLEGRFKEDHRHADSLGRD